MAFNFSDTLTNYKHQLRLDDMGDMYWRAGTPFRGQLQQNFEVLRTHITQVLTQMLMLQKHLGSTGVTSCEGNNLKGSLKVVAFPEKKKKKLKKILI
jgi:hypothetical protein